MHVLGPPQTFALSQDQTLQFDFVGCPPWLNDGTLECVVTSGFRLDRATRVSTIAGRLPRGRSRLLALARLTGPCGSWSVFLLSSFQTAKDPVPLEAWPVAGPGLPSALPGGAGSGDAVSTCDRGRRQACRRTFLLADPPRSATTPLPGWPNFAAVRRGPTRLARTSSRASHSLNKFAGSFRRWLGAG